MKHGIVEFLFNTATVVVPTIFGKAIYIYRYLLYAPRGVAVVVSMIIVGSRKQKIDSESKRNKYIFN